MHLVFLNQYYPPDAAPTGVMLEGLVEGLLREGHEVSVLCAAGGYAGSQASRSRIADGGSQLEEGSTTADSGLRMEAGSRKHSASVSILSIPSPRSTIHDFASPRIIRIGATRFGRGTFLGKLFDYASYWVGVSWKLLTLRPAPQRIVALTTPPYLSVLARVMSKLRGADHAHWVMDLYPEVLAAHGMLDGRGLVYRLLAGLAGWGFGGKRCAAVLTLGPDMAELVEKRVRKKVTSYQLSVISDCGEEPRHRAQDLQTTGDEQPTTECRVHWVPLWGGVRKAIGNQLSGVSDENRSGIADRGSQIEEERGRGAAASLPSLHHPLSTIPDPQSTNPALALRRARGWGDDDVVVMYSGNMGLGHRFGEILEAAGGLGRGSQIADGGSQIEEERGRSAAASLSSIHDPLSTIPDPPSPAAPRLRLVFFGGGKRRDEVARFAREHPQAGVELYDYAPADDLMAHLQSADVHLASLDPAWTGTMVPSKVQGIFAAARPVIFIGCANSSIGRWVRASGGGWVVAAGDVAGLLAALADASDPTQRAIRGRGAQEFAAEHFDQDRNVARIATILTHQAPRP